MMRKIFAGCMVLVLMVGALSTLLGCNTVKGVGRDIEQSGQALQDAVK